MSQMSQKHADTYALGEFDWKVDLLEAAVDLQIAVTISCAPTLIGWPIRGRLGAKNPAEAAVFDARTAEATVARYYPGSQSYAPFAASLFPALISSSPQSIHAFLASFLA
ncbi:hypothetical protein MKZ38_001964 [Zalerion maritima]|uniref:Uncharacterized protein n=1 Tax=Zalerion maritima TaxID=339359 RepID=A0AAD5RFE3_9PEZI|nr:hypothetical protein MKZ38_001964 [Zalerion maritima]